MTTPCPDVLLLASWSDGRATAKEASAVDAHLAECAGCLEAIRELRWVEAQLETRMRDGRVFAPVDVVARARALVPEPSGAPRSASAVEVTGVAGLRLGWLRRAGWSLAAAAAIAACVGGYQLGSRSYRLSDLAAATLADAMSFGVFDPVDDLGDDADPLRSHAIGDAMP